MYIPNNRFFKFHYQPSCSRGLYWPAYLVAFLIYIIGYLINPLFISPFNVSNLINQITPLLIVSLGQVLIIISGGVDLSVGATMSLTTTITAQVMSSTGSIFLGIILVFTAGFLIGLMNGLGIVKLNINPFIMTLASMTIIQGVAFFILPAPGGSIPLGFSSFFTGTFIGKLPNALFINIFLILLCLWFLNKTYLGRTLYAVGFNRKVANEIGINVTKTTIVAFILSSTFAVLAGLFLSARIMSGDPVIAEAYSLNSIAAVALGGTSIGGGIGSIIGTIPGAIIMATVENLLNFAGIQTYYQYILRGLILVFSVGFFTRRHSLG